MMTINEMKIQYERNQKTINELMQCNQLLVNQLIETQNELAKLIKAAEDYQAEWEADEPVLFTIDEIISYMLEAGK